MRKFQKSLWNTVRLFLFPVRCAGCGKNGAALCERCAGKIALSKETEHAWSKAVFSYEDPLVEKIIHECKYRTKSAAYEALVESAIPIIEELLSEHVMSVAPSNLVFVPVPLSRSHTSRGFNQSALAASIIARAIGGSVDNALRSVKKTIPQARLKHKTDRLNNLRGSMQASHYIDPLKCHVVFDDVTTTGATFIEARRALRDAGAKHVFCIALAHGYSRKHARIDWRAKTL